MMKVCFCEKVHFYFFCHRPCWCAGAGEKGLKSWLAPTLYPITVETSENYSYLCTIVVAIRATLHKF